MVVVVAAVALHSEGARRASLSVHRSGPAARAEEVKVDRAARDWVASAILLQSDGSSTVCPDMLGQFRAALAAIVGGRRR